ncbi:MAG: type I methionyl aminopeptidase [Spirochaetes bacterium]|nr:type I methionyl aminopeptidase [Spirochaetota bacterium]
MHELKNKSEIVYIRQACRIVSDLLMYIKELTKPGITTRRLDTKAEEFIKKRGGTPAFKNYNGFPSSICTSVNEGVIHGIPSTKRLKEGDVLSVDVGVRKAGYYGDAAITLPVGQIDGELSRLLKVTEEALYSGIERALCGNHIGDISRAIQERVEKDGFSVVRDFVGHGVGKKLHEEPPIPNYKTPGRGPLLVSGMTLAIEPMVNMGTYEVEILEDNWTVVTRDGSPSAHFEHTILVTEDGPEILTMY